MLHCHHMDWTHKLSYLMEGLNVILGGFLPESLENLLLYCIWVNHAVWVMILFLLLFFISEFYSCISTFINACILQSFINHPPVLRILVVTEHCPHSIRTQCQPIVDVVPRTILDLWTCSSGTSIFFYLCPWWTSVIISMSMITERQNEM